MSPRGPTAPGAAVAAPTPAPEASRHRTARLAGLLLGRVELALGWTCAGILGLLLALVIVAVALRYLFATAVLGSDEAAIWLHVALIGAGAPLAAGSALGMRLDVLVRRLSPPAQAAAAVVADALIFLSALVLCLGGVGIVQALGGTSPSLGLPEWIRFAFLAAGGGLTLLVLALGRIAEERAASLLLSAALAGCLYLGAQSLSLSSGLPPSAVAGLVAAFGLCVGTPLPHLFLAAACLAIPFGSPLPEPAIVATSVAGMSKFLLLAIPFFLLAGELLTVSGLVARLIRFASAMVGHLRGGLAQTALLTGTLFSGASGSSVANAAFGASTFAPALIARGYPPARAGAVVAATSVLDNVIPPSIAFLILAAATNLSVGRLLVGGFVAGAVMAAALAIAFHLTTSEQPTRGRASGGERLRAAVAAAPAFGLGAIVVVGIRFGVVTPTEAAALAALYTLLAALVGRAGRAVTLEAFRDAGVSSAAIGLLIGSAAPIAFMLAVDGAHEALAALVTALDAGAVGVMLLATVVLLAAGLVLDTGAAILLFGPVLLPIAVAVGIDPIHFGVILVVNLMIGGLTPPVGILVYVVGGVMRLPASTIFHAVLPYVAALIGALALLCAGALAAAHLGS